MYEELMSYEYDLEIDGDAIAQNDVRREGIVDLTLKLRRNDSSSLSITFNDPTLIWHDVFAKTYPIRVVFRGRNLGGSVEEEFMGYAALVTPTTDLNKYTLEVVFLDIHPDLNRSQPKSRVFKGMTRKSIIQQLASESKARLELEETSYINQSEDETTLGENESIIQFVSRLLDEIGYRISIVGLDTWIVTPKIPLKRAVNIHANLNKDGSLLTFNPSLVAYSYPNDTKDSDGEDGDGITSAAIDPDTKSTSETIKDTLTKAKEKASQMVQDLKTGEWFKASEK